ncbi:MAG: archaeosortase A [Archaeoglobaceae archaeon]|nr:archaeosortase A [Candidatus Aenigmarchaeota archaeon]MCX8172300.1 archaeosortase A [Archaeoglobaceae archaeon]
MLSEIIASISVIPMLIYVLKKKASFGSIAWTLFALACLTKAKEFFNGGDYVNFFIFILGGIFFILIAKAILTTNSKTFLEVTAFSALACIVYFPFVFVDLLGSALIEITAFLTAELGKMLGYPMNAYDKIIELNGSYVEIILACTAIESIALFTGATIGINANGWRKIKAFAVSVPLIYFLNLLRNAFVIVSFAYSLFGENSFYIAHHVIAKFFSFIALVAIAYAVFRILPELTELIYSLKKEVVRGVRL